MIQWLFQTQMLLFTSSLYLSELATVDGNEFKSDQRIPPQEFIWNTDLTFTQVRNLYADETNMLMDKITSSISLKLFRFNPHHLASSDEPELIITTVTRVFSTASLTSSSFSNRKQFSTMMSHVNVNYYQNDEIETNSSISPQIITSPNWLFAKANQWSYHPTSFEVRTIFRFHATLWETNAVLSSVQQLLFRVSDLEQRLLRGEV